MASSTARRALDWAYGRHTNKLSWYIRPLWILPLGYAAWRRSATGIALSLAGLLTSMVWFPKPKRIDPRVQRFLDMEKNLFVDFRATPTTVLGTAAVPITMALVLTAFWQRSLAWALVVTNQAAVLKLAWSVRQGGQSGWSVLAPAVTGCSCATPPSCWPRAAMASRSRSGNPRRRPPRRIRRWRAEVRGADPSRRRSSSARR